MRSHASGCWLESAAARSKSEERRRHSANSWSSWGCRASSGDDERPRLRVEVRGQAVEREQPRGVEEEGELCDLGVLELKHLQRPRVQPGVRVARLVLTKGDCSVGCRHG